MEACCRSLAIARMGFMLTSRVAGSPHFPMRPTCTAHTSVCVHQKNFQKQFASLCFEPCLGGHTATAHRQTALPPHSHNVVEAGHCLTPSRPSPTDENQADSGIMDGQQKRQKETRQQQAAAATRERGEGRVRRGLQGGTIIIMLLPSHCR